MERIDIFVLPSRIEGFGISLVEAMAKGIPVIASRIVGPDEVLQKGKYGQLFDVGDREGLADKIDYTIQNYEKYKSLAVKSVDYIKDNYSIESMCGKLESIYKL